MKVELPWIPSPGVAAFYLVDGCILFSEPHQQAIALNMTAGVIWSMLEDGRPLDEAARALVTDFNLTEAQAEGFVTSAATEWQALGLLVGPSEPAPAPGPASDKPGRAPGRSPAGARVYALAGISFSLHCDGGAHAALVLPILDHLSVAARKDVDFTIEVVTTADGHEVRVDGGSALACSTLSEIAPLVKGVVWAEAVNRSDFLFGFHAGAVASPSGALLLPGPSGSGKSTLTAHLLAAGMDYLSDEMALLSKQDLKVRRLPLALCVKDTGADVVAALFPALADLPFHQRADGKRVAYLPPPTTAVEGAEEFRDVCALVFPTFVAGEPTRLEPMSTSEAVRRLLTECLAAGKRLARHDIAQLISWAETRSRRRLIFGSAPEATSLLTAFMADPGRSPP